METRIAILGIIVENMDSVSEVNELLHEYNKYIIGRECLTVKKMCR